MRDLLRRRFVSRGGEKLAAALEHFSIDATGLTCADLGSHVGGFVDCLLQQGAARVYSVDTSYGTLAWKLRKDPRVVVLERTNALHVQLPESVDFFTIDVGWTPQALILSSVARMITSSAKSSRDAECLSPNSSDGSPSQSVCEKPLLGDYWVARAACLPVDSEASTTETGSNLPLATASHTPSRTECTPRVVTLIKPHYEASPEQLHGGVLTDEAADAVVARVMAEATSAGWEVQSTFPSPLRGHAGNREVFALLTPRQPHEDLTQ